MKKYTIEISQNGWEYTGYAFVIAREVKKIDRETVLADGVVIKFDEEIGLIKEEVLDNDAK